MKNASPVAFAKANWAVLLVLGLSSVAAIWFALGFCLNLVYFNDPRHQDEALKPWMTPRYVVMSYDLPREVVADVLKLPDTGPSRLKLGTLAANMGVTLDELTARVRDAASVYREGQP